MASPGSDIDVALQELEARLERLRSLYEQYFIGIEKLEPSIPRQDVDRRIYALRKVQIRNTAKRFKLQNIIQRYNAFQQYWLRICREIENGTYHRHVARAQSRFGDVPLTAAARRKARLQPASPEQQAAAEHKSRATRAAEDDLDSLLNEDPEVALQRALEEADQVTAPATPVPVAAAPASMAVEMPLQVAAPLPVPSSEGASLPPKAVPLPKPPARKRPPAPPDGSIPPTQLAEKRAPVLPNTNASVAPVAPIAAQPAEKRPAAPSPSLPNAPRLVEKAAAAGEGPQALATSLIEPAGRAAQAPVVSPNAAGATATVAAPPAQARRPAAQKPAMKPAAKPAEARADSWAALRVPTAEERAAKATRPGVGADPATAPPAVPKAPQGIAATGSAAKPVVPAVAQRPAAAPPEAQPSATARVNPTGPARPVAMPVAPAAPVARVNRTKSVAPPAPTARVNALSNSRLDDQRVSQLHDALVAERRRLQQPGKVSVDALASSLRDTELKLRQQYADKDIDFHVVVKNGKAVVKPIIG